MRSSPSVVRLPGPVRGISVSRSVESYRFSEEGARERARKEAARAAQDVEARLGEAREEGRREGLAEGTARGRQEAEARVREAVQLVEKVASRLSAEREAVLANAEEDLLRLAIAVASRVVRREVSADREVVVRILGDALRRASPLEDVVVRLHPADYRMLREAPGLLAGLSEIRHFELVEDRRVGQGGCLIETGSGAIDARLETALEEIERALGRAAERERPGAAPD